MSFRSLTLHETHRVLPQHSVRIPVVYVCALQGKFSERIGAVLWMNTVFYMTGFVMVCNERLKISAPCGTCNPSATPRCHRLRKETPQNNLSFRDSCGGCKTSKCRPHSSDAVEKLLEVGATEKTRWPLIPAPRTDLATLKKRRSSARSLPPFAQVPFDWSGSTNSFQH